MTGLQRNVEKLLSNQGKLFVAAFDHPQIYGAMAGLENPMEAIDNLLDSSVDGFILNPGIMNKVCAKKLASKKLILRASVGGTMMGTTFSDKHDVIVSPKTAINLGADAILIMLCLGGSADKEQMVEAARTAELFHEYSIPVIMEVLCADYTKNNDTEFIRNGARIGAELGADMIKAFYCDDFKSVVDNCPVPVILAGGPKGSDILDVSASVVKDGAKGFAFGRNIFQAENPKEMVENIAKVLR